MTDPHPNPRFSCLSLVLLLAVAGGVAAAFIFGWLGPRAASWPTIGAAALAAVAVFVIERRLKNLFWATLASLLLSMHPRVRQPAGEPIDLLAQAGVLAGLAAAAVAWHLAYHVRFAWKLWPLVGGAIVASAGLVWVANPSLGLVAAGLLTLALLPAAVLARYRRRRVEAHVPARLNVLTALLLAMLGPAGAIYLSQVLDLSRFEQSLREAWQGFLDQPAQGLAQLGGWCWPTPWLMLPLLAWAWWRTLKRGWRDWKAGHVPASWYLSILVVLLGISLMPRPQGAELVLVGMSVVLATWWVADVWKGTVEQLILLPPEEERPPAEDPVTTAAVLSEPVQDLREQPAPR